MSNIILPIEIETRIILSLKLTEISKLNNYYKCKAEDIASRIIQRNIKSYILSKKYFNLNADTFDDNFNVHNWINRFAPLRYRMDWIYEKTCQIKYGSYFEAIENVLERIKFEHEINEKYNNEELILSNLQMTKNIFQANYYNQFMHQYIFINPSKSVLYKNIIESFYYLSKKLKKGLGDIMNDSMAYYAIYNFIFRNFIYNKILNEIKKNKTITNLMYFLNNKESILELYECIIDSDHIIINEYDSDSEYDYDEYYHTIQED